MRIHCSVRKFIRERYFPFVTFSMRTSGFTGFVDALIDTGSPFTVLSPKDIMSSRLSLKTMQRGETVSLAGSRFFNYTLKDVTMFFKDENGNLLKIELPSMGALVPTKIDEKTLDEVKHIPTIVGNDFLEDQHFTLCFNPSERVAFLERP